MSAPPTRGAPLNLVFLSWAYALLTLLAALLYAGAHPSLGHVESLEGFWVVPAPAVVGLLWCGVKWAMSGSAKKQQ